MGRVGPADLTSQFWAEDGRSPRKSAQINVSFVLRGNKSDSLLGWRLAAQGRKERRVDVGANETVAGFEEPLWDGAHPFK